MKLLKDEIRSSIVKAAKKEFLSKGFANSSMRDIAGRAGITVGNIYKYFKDKESLLAHIVDPVYLQIKNFIEHHDDNLESQTEYTMDAFVAEQVFALNLLINNARDEFLILLFGSAGSRYEGIDKKMISLLSEGVRDHLSVYYSTVGIENKNIDILSYAIARSFLEGLFSIIKNSKNENETRKLCEEYITISLNGFKNILHIEA